LTIPVALKKRPESDVKSILQHSPIALLQGDEYVQKRLAQAQAKIPKQRKKTRTHQFKAFELED